MQGRDPRFGQPATYPQAPGPHGPQAGYAQQPAPYGQQPYAQQQPAPYAQQPAPYVPPPAPYSQPPPPQQQYPQQQYPQPQYPQQQHPQPAPSAGGWQAQMAARAGGLNLPGGMGKVGQISGLPAPVSFGLGLVAVLVALVFDVIFLKVHIPGVGSYAWYLTTALSFAGAGWASIKWTRASKTVAMTALGVAAGIYGVADLGLGLVLEDLSMAGAIMLGAQGVGIGLFTGFGGVFKAIRERDEASE